MCSRLKLPSLVQMDDSSQRMQVILSNSVANLSANANDLSSEFEFSLIGSWLNCVLLAIELFVASAYLSKYYSQIRRPTKWAILGMLCNDTIQSLVVCATVYLVRALSMRI